MVLSCCSTQARSLLAERICERPPVTIEEVRCHAGQDPSGRWVGQDLGEEFANVAAGAA
jgi:hypothetical protein